MAIVACSVAIVACWVAVVLDVSACVLADSACVFAVSACVLNACVSFFICCNSVLYVDDTCKPKVETSKLVSDNLIATPFTEVIKPLPRFNCNPDVDKDKLLSDNLMPDPDELSTNPPSVLNLKANLFEASKPKWDGL